MDPAFKVPPEVVPDLNKLVPPQNPKVDTIFADKQQRLLIEPLYSCWTGQEGGRPFLAVANVAYYPGSRVSPLLPDVLLAIDMAPVDDLHARENHSYFQWVRGFSPDVVIDIVSELDDFDEQKRL